MVNRVKTVTVSQFERDRDSSEIPDSVVVESPLEIRLVAGPESNRRSKSLSITMRTPGDDFDLACGFLVSEGVVRSPEQILKIEYCGTVADGEANSNLVSVELTPDTPFDLQSLQRNFYTTSSCGVCGKASLQALEAQCFLPVNGQITIDKAALFGLTDQLRERQAVFSETGGIHAAGMFTSNGDLLAVCEDVGRHNAVDKLIGHQFRQGNLPLNDRVLVVSGRASFELLQKTVAAGIPIFVAVGAPSDLAVQLAQEFNVTLIGFASGSRFNVYSHFERIQ